MELFSSLKVTKCNLTSSFIYHRICLFNHPTTVIQFNLYDIICLSVNTNLNLNSTSYLICLFNLDVHILNVLIHLTFQLYNLIS